MSEPAETAQNLKRTALHDLWRELGAKMTPFAGYEMPVHFPMGVLKEHLHARAAAALFDVSHMGQVRIQTREAALGSPEAHAAVAQAFEAVCPADIAGLKPGRLRYGVLVSADGGVLDDLIAGRPGAPGEQGRLALVVNGAVKAQDMALLQDALQPHASAVLLDARALLALQGPASAQVLARQGLALDDMGFMSRRPAEIAGRPVMLSRCGYTGEDGFEIAMDAADAEAVARALLSDEAAAPAGLGARDSLRLEAGLPLYGQDMTLETSPIEAGAAFSIGKRRRAAGDFPGAARILRELADGPARRLVGVRPEGRAPARAGAPILSADGRKIGVVTSGGFGPSVGAPVALGYVPATFAQPGTEIALEVRGKALPARVAETPFVPHRYYRT